MSYKLRKPRPSPGNVKLMTDTYTSQQITKALIGGGSFFNPNEVMLAACDVVSVSNKNNSLGFHTVSCFSFLNKYVCLYIDLCNSFIKHVIIQMLILLL